MAGAYSTVMPMDANLTLTEALLAAATIAIFFFACFYGLYRVVVWARRQRTGAYVLGAALSPFMIGNVADPDLRIVQEAKRLKNREDDDPGDPPDGDGEDLAAATPDRER